MALLGAQLLGRTLELESTRALVESRLGDALGLAVRIDGDFRLDLFPRPHLQATQFTVASPPGRAAAELLKLGEVELLLELWPLLRGRVEVDAVRLHNGTLHLEEDDQGRLGLMAEPDALEGGAPEDGTVDTLGLRELEVHDVWVFYRRAGESADWSLRLDELLFKAPGLRAALGLRATGEMEGNSFTLDAELGSLSQLLGAADPFPFELTLETERAELRGSGTVQDPRTLRGVDVEIDAEFQDLGRLSDREAPAIGPVSFHARLHDEDDALAAHDIALRALADAPFRGSVTGSITDLRAFGGVALDLELASDDAEFLAALLPEPFDAAETLQVSARISDADQTLGVEGTLRASADQDRILVELEGSHDDLSRLHELEAKLHASAADLERLGRVLDLETDLPPLGPLAVQAVLVGHDGVFGARDIEIELGTLPELRVSARGSVRDLAIPAGVALSLEFEGRDQPALGRRLGREFPALGPLRGSALLDDRDGSIGVENFEISGGTPGVLTLTASGYLDHLSQLDDLELQLRVDARDLAVVGSYLGVELPPIGPVEARGSARGSDEHLESRGSLRLGQTRIKGLWAAEFPAGRRPKLRGRLRSDRLYLKDLGIYPREDAPDPGPQRTLDTTLPHDRLQDVDLDIELAAARISGHDGLEGTDALIDLDLAGGLLTTRVRTEYERGAVDVSIGVDSGSDEPRHTLRVLAQGVDMTRLAAQFQKDTDFAGLLGSDVSLTARGHTPRALLASLGGHFRVTGREGALVSSWARAFVFDFARVSLPTVRTSGREEIRCAALFASLDKGVATIEALVLDAPRVRVSGSGRIDLAGNRFDLLLEPRARDPGLVSVASDVRLTGPLANPRIRPVARTIATSAARALVSNARRPADFVWRSLRGSAPPETADGCPKLAEKP